MFGRVTLASATAISKVPTVSMLEAMMGTPSWVSPEWRKLNLRYRFTWKPGGGGGGGGRGGGGRERRGGGGGKKKKTGKLNCMPDGTLEKLEA